MSNLSKALRTELAEKFYILDSKLLAKHESRDGTTKYLLEFSPNHQVEAVLIPAKEHLTACLSTQFGCPVKCAFCATGQGPFTGNMSAGQIVEQFLQLQTQADLLKERVSLSFSWAGRAFAQLRCLDQGDPDYQFGLGV